MFVDDTKMCKWVKGEEDCNILQNDLDKIWKWSKEWEMEFNENKSHVMEMGKSERRPVGMYKMGEEVILKKVVKEKDLIMHGVQVR